MSKLQASENSLVDIANTTLANQLESRLKELERNIAVARQFIGMADECYSKVKHEWELLQQDIGVKNATTGQTRHLSSLEDRIDESEIMGTVRREKKSRSESQRKRPRILPTSQSDRRITLSLRRTENRVEKSQKLPARVSSRAKSPSIQRRLSRSSRSPEHFSDSQSASTAP